MTCQHKTSNCTTVTQNLGSSGIPAQTTGVFPTKELKQFLRQRKKLLGYVGKNSLKQSLNSIYHQLLQETDPAAYCRALLQHWLQEGYLPHNANQGVICLNLDLILTQVFGESGYLENLIIAAETKDPPRYSHLEVGWFKDRAFYQDYH